MSFNFLTVGATLLLNENGGNSDYCHLLDTQLYIYIYIFRIFQ